MTERQLFTFFSFLSFFFLRRPCAQRHRDVPMHAHTSIAISTHTEAEPSYLGSSLHARAPTRTHPNTHTNTRTCVRTRKPRSSPSLRPKPCYVCACGDKRREAMFTYGFLVSLVQWLLVLPRGISAACVFSELAY